jgi:hypothetical protein
MHVFPLLLIPFVLLQKKFWVEVKPVNSKEKKLFMVVHDDGVTATANPESATFPDTCEVELNMADAELLHEKKGIIIGVRNPDTNLYRVQLHRQGQEETIDKWGSPIVEAKENELKWNTVRPGAQKTETEQPTVVNIVRPDAQKTEAEQATETAERAYLRIPHNNNPSKQKKLPARPTFSLFNAVAHNGNSTNSQIPFVSPHTVASIAPPAGGGLADACPSPPQPRSQLDSPSFRSATLPLCCSLSHQTLPAALSLSLAPSFSTSADPPTNIEAQPLSLKQKVRRRTAGTAPWMLQRCPQLQIQPSHNRRARLATPPRIPTLQFS